MEGGAGQFTAPGANWLCQAQPGSAPDIQGQDRANPTSMILSVAMLLQWLGEHHEEKSLAAPASSIQTAVDKVQANPATRTTELGSSLG